MNFYCLIYLPFNRLFTFFLCVCTCYCCNKRLIYIRSDRIDTVIIFIPVLCYRLMTIDILFISRLVHDTASICQLSRHNT